MTTGSPCTSAAKWLLDPKDGHRPGGIVVPEVYRETHGGQRGARGMCADIPADLLSHSHIQLVSSIPQTQCHTRIAFYVSGMVRGPRRRCCPDPPPLHSPPPCRPRLQRCTNTVRVIEHRPLRSAAEGPPVRVEGSIDVLGAACLMNREGTAAPATPAPSLPCLFCPQTQHVPRLTSEP